MPAPAPVQIFISNYKAFFNEQGTSGITEAEPEKEPAEIEGELKAPAIQLVLKGLFESEGNQNTFIVEAVVTGNPEPKVTFSRDDSSGGMGKYKALINMAPNSEFTVSATAVNSEGSASSQINISTRKKLSLRMNILNGPEYVSRVTCYYLVEIKLEGNPLPDAFTLEAGGKTLQFTTETGTGSKGKFQMKREKRMLADKFETEDYPKWETYEGVGMIWIGDEIKTADEPLIIQFLEDGSKFMLAPNSWMKITEVGIEIKDGEGSFTITKTKDGVKTLKNTFLSNFSLSAITGTSFVLDVKAARHF